MTRLRRTIKRTAIGLVALVAVLLIVNAILAWRASRRLDQKLAALRADGQPTCIADLAPESIPADQNAAAILAGIRDDLSEFTKKHSEFCMSPLGSAFDNVDEKGELPTSEQKAAMAAILDSFPRISVAIDRAASCEQYASQLDFSLGPDSFQETLLEAAQPFRSVARFLGWRNFVLLADGRHEEALEASTQLLRLARLCENEPTLVHYLVTIAVRAMAADGINRALRAGPVSDELHAALDEELARHDDPQRMVRVLRKERAYGITASANWQCGAPAFLVWPMKNMCNGMLDFYEEQIPIADQPWHEIQSKIDAEAIPTPGMFDTEGFGAAMLLPAIQATHVSTNRNNALLRCLRILNAIKAFEEEAGQEVKRLADLDLPKAATIDPFSGKPLQLKRTALGWVVYSVARDEIDDDGDLRELCDVGVAPVGYEMYGPW